MSKIMTRKQICTILSLTGYLFVFAISIITALSIEQFLWRVLLIASAIITLVLAITRLLFAKKMGERVKYLEDNHLSLSYDKEEECIAVKKGIQ